MMREPEQLIDRILNLSGVPSFRRRSEIQRELRCHIEDFVDAARAAGRDDEEIRRLVLAHFGDPEEIGDRFAWVYRQERRRMRAAAFFVATLLLASSVLAAMLALQAGVAFSLGLPVLRMLASRHTEIEALDILASAAAYLGIASLEGLFRTQRFLKGTAVTAGVYAILVASCAALDFSRSFLIFGLVNGTFSRAMQLLVRSSGARFSIGVICFAATGLILTFSRAPVSWTGIVQTSISWMALGAGYYVMSHSAVRVDAAVFMRLQRREG